MYEPKDENDYDKDNADWNKFYFKFDVTSSPLSDWVQKMIDQIVGKSVPLDPNTIGYSPVSFPVNGCFSNTVSGGNSLLYLGNNHYNEPIYKAKHFLENKVQNAYTNHLQQHASYFVKQPAYYKGLYDILN